ncbi:DUF4097 family beta strand repeat-containing protein [Actinoplanes sp. NPDC051861]|uniref:DUF4097 family beta strand repeat-containing protein n=1 Tax=Actinoplanes sp. NPDC051861 TaxID=3155170 RepID=UPI00342EC465
MSKFETPEPISVTVELNVGNVRVTAGPRADTVVEVRPTDESNESDVQAVQQIRVEYDNGVLRVTGPKRIFDFSRKTRSVDVSIALPAGSRLAAVLEVGSVTTIGRLGECRLKSAAGNFTVEQAGPLRVHTAAGHVTVDTVSGRAEISTGSGRIQIGDVDGAAEVKNSNGDTVIDAVTGDLRARSANGDITVEHAGADVDAKSSNGAIRLGEVVRGSVLLGASMGELEIGIAEGTAAWLDVNTSFGQVRNLMENAVGPEDAQHTVEVRGNTSFGDITVRRAHLP